MDVDPKDTEGSSSSSLISDPRSCFWPRSVSRAGIVMSSVSSPWPRGGAQCSVGAIQGKIEG